MAPGDLFDLLRNARLASSLVGRPGPGGNIGNYSARLTARPNVVAPGVGLLVMFSTYWSSPLPLSLWGSRIQEF